MVANDLKGFTEAMSDMDLWKNVPRDRFRRRLQAVENAVEARGTRERLIGEAKARQKGLRKQVREGAEEARRKALQDDELRRAREEARRAEEERKRLEEELRKPTGPEA